jgi:hypothetical protein
MSLSFSSKGLSFRRARCSARDVEGLALEEVFVAIIVSPVGA